MKSFSNMSHLDLLIIWGGLKLLKVMMFSTPYNISDLMTKENIESVIGELQDKVSINERIDQLVLAIEAELPNATEEKL
jgi:hypothetical protein